MCIFVCVYEWDFFFLSNFFFFFWNLKFGTGQVFLAGRSAVAIVSHEGDDAGRRSRKLEEGVLEEFLGRGSLRWLPHQHQVQEGAQDRGHLDRMRGRSIPELYYGFIMDYIPIYLRNKSMGHLKWKNKAAAAILSELGRIFALKGERKGMKGNIFPLSTRLALARFCKPL